MDAAILISLSIIIQLITAFFAMRLIPLTRGRIAWVLISLALFLMAMRRVITVYHWKFEDASHPIDVTAELIGVIVSLIMLAGIVRIAPLFHSLRSSREAVKLERDRFMSILDSMHDFVYIVGPNYDVQYVNPSALKKFGPHEGRKCSLYFHGTEDVCPWCKNEEVFSGKTIRWVWEHPDKIRAYDVFDTPIHNPDGSISKLEILHDITEQKAAQDLLRRANRTLKVLSESNDALVHEADEMELLNRVCRIIVESGGYRLVWVGYAQDDPEKTVKPVAHAGVEEEYVEKTVVTWADEARGQGPTGSAIRTGEPCAARDIPNDPKFLPWREAVLKHGFASSLALPLKLNGNTFGALSIYATEPDAFGDDESDLLKSLAQNLSYGIASIRTRQERSRTEEELNVYMAKLEQSNQALREFAYVASHDLQEPLRKIINFGDLLHDRSGKTLDDIGRDCLQRMQSAARRMQTLIQALLSFSRINTREEPFVPVDLAHLVRSVLEDLEVRIKETGGVVEVGELNEIEADPIQMRQLFQNLIGNALKFHRKGEAPIVKIQGERFDGGLYRVTVQDNGIGFDEKELEYLFTPFHRLHGMSQYEGTGMGLAICRKIAERHGGGITARSAPGQGSTFVVTLLAKQ